MVKKVNMAAICLAAAVSAFAYTANYWQAVDGNWNGKYSDVRHWSRGHLPYFNSTSDAEDAVFDNRSGAQYNVEIDVDIGEGDIPAPAFFKVSNANIPGPLYPVRFYGNGKITQSAAAALFIYDNAIAIFDGDIKANFPGGGVSSYTNRCIYVRGNANLKVNGTFYLGANSLLEISGGVLECGSFNPDAAKPSTFRMTGGELRVGGFGTIAPPEATVEFIGGKIVQTEGQLRDPRFMPQVGAVYDAVTTSVYAINFATPFTNEIAGTLFATNDLDITKTDKCSWLRLQYAAGSSVLYGSGVISV